MRFERIPSKLHLTHYSSYSKPSPPIHTFTNKIIFINDINQNTTSRHIICCQHTLNLTSKARTHAEQLLHHTALFYTTSFYSTLIFFDGLASASGSREMGHLIAFRVRYHFITLYHLLRCCLSSSLLSA